MQFIPNGPDIPENLLQSHEEGKVVFICGAGVSYPAGLPNFKGLVERVYAEADTNRLGHPIEENAFGNKQYDTTLHLLERRLPNGRTGLEMRSALKKALKPKLRRKYALRTHSALLKLSRTRDDSLRLITTNFDELFEISADKLGIDLSIYKAPLLPITKQSRWSGLVYLHGKLPKNENSKELNDLVVTSADFGLSYLTERWASRFVSEVFRSYIVCFVGYSVDDPVMRYIVDALAADQQLGEEVLPVYAFSSYAKGKNEEVQQDWLAKGITPIIYSEAKKHSALHETLDAWARIYHDGSLGKERIVTQYAITKPSESTVDDNFVGRMLWALSDASGHSARRFAEHNPAPSLEWLDAFSSRRYRSEDLYRFGISPIRNGPKDIEFSLVQRPSSYIYSKWMSLVSHNYYSSRLDIIMEHLAIWLCRHLNNPRLVLWIATNGGKLHDDWAWKIERKLIEIYAIEKSGNTESIELLRSESPDMVPSLPMRKLWRLILDGHVKGSTDGLLLHDWKRKFEHFGSTNFLRLNLRKLLTPKIKLRAPVSFFSSKEELSDHKSISSIVNWEISLRASDISAFIDLARNDSWLQELPNIIPDLQQLLNDALNLMAELEYYDPSYRLHIPSIAPHPQNKKYREWVILVELLRDAWLELERKEPARAALIAEEWFNSHEHVMFKRLALFAAASSSAISTSIWLDWLELESGEWLWSLSTHRETLRLLASRSNQLNSAELQRLETIILAGPAPSAETDQETINRAVWLRLAKLKQGGGELSSHSTEWLHNNGMPEPDLAPDEERREFLSWSEVSWGSYSQQHDSGLTDIPKKTQALHYWLEESGITNLEHAASYREEWPYSGQWQKMCRQKPLITANALLNIDISNIPTNFWTDTFYAWSETAHKDRALATALKVCQKVLSHNQPLPQNILRPISTWLEKVTSQERAKNNRASILLIAQIIIDNSADEALDNTDYILSAINHPVGQITQALLNIWLLENPEDNQGLPSDIYVIFDKICKENNTRYINGKVILASHVITLYRADQPWASTELLPLFNWSKSTVAAAVWTGFLHAPRLFPSLFDKFKTSFLNVEAFLSSLNEDYQHQYIIVLTYISLNLELHKDYSQTELQQAFSGLKSDNLAVSATAIEQMLKSHSEEARTFWHERIKPFWKNIWPKHNKLRSTKLSSSLIKVMLASQDVFPLAMETMKNWIQPLEHYHMFLEKLKESGICSVHPKSALNLLSLAVDTDQLNGNHNHKLLLDCLTQIKTQLPSAESLPQYRTLIEICRTT